MNSRIYDFKQLCLEDGKESLHIWLGLQGPLWKLEVRSNLNLSLFKSL